MLEYYCDEGERDRANTHSEDSMNVEEVQELACLYNEEFGDAELDKEWTETAYNDLGRAEQEQISWADFHDAIQASR